MMKTLSLLCLMLIVGCAPTRVLPTPSFDGLSGHIDVAADEIKKAGSVASYAKTGMAKALKELEGAKKEITILKQKIDNLASIASKVPELETKLAKSSARNAWLILIIVGLCVIIGLWVAAKTVLKAYLPFL